MRRLAIRLLSLILMLMVAPMSAVAQDRIVSARFVMPGTSTMQDVHTFRVTFSRLAWVVDGTPTTCSFRMEQSNDGISWTDFTTPQDCTLSGKTVFVSAPFVGKFLRHNLTTLTVGGILNIFWEGFHGDRCGFDYSGVFSTIISPDPAAGEELSIGVPLAERWRVYSASFQLQANNVNADREVSLTASNSGNEYFRTLADGEVKANQKGIFTAAALGFVSTAGLGSPPASVRTILIPIYSEAFIPGGHTLATSTNGLQVGDDYSPVVVLVERCPN